MNRDRTALLVAVGALLALGAGIVYLTFEVADADPTKWARLQYLFGAVQAVAFAGAGWLWGKEVHREQAERAETRLDAAHQGATAAARAEGKAQGNLQTLADAVVANAGMINRVHDDIGGGLEPLVAARVIGVRPSLEALVALAGRYQGDRQL